MPASSERFVFSNQTRLYVAYVLLFAWMAFLAWFAAWPLGPLSVLVLLFLGYAAFRFVFELTFNRANVPTLVTCFVARQKIAKVLRKEAAQRASGSFAVVDLGSGRGELARCIAKKVPDAKVTGVETAIFPFMQSSLVQHLFGPGNLAYERRDFWSLDCSTFNAVVLYLGPVTAQRMGEKLRQELKQGSMVISYTYPLLGEWKAIDVQNFCTPFKETFYVYRR